MAASDERRLQALVLAPVRRVQRRLNAVAWAHAGIAPVWATATACVLARLLFRDAAVWGIAPLVLLGGAAWRWRARGVSVSLEHAAVLADRSANAGGLLLTRLERPVGEWELAVNQLAGTVKPPDVEWRRPVGAVAGALVFLLVGFLLPLPPVKGPRKVHAAAAAKVDAVQSQAEALAREEPLGEALEDELRRLSEEVAAGRFDATDWEAADSLERRLAERASEAAAELARASEAARELEEALGAAGGAEAANRERESLERALMALDAKPPEQTERGGPGQASNDASRPGQSGARGDGEGAEGQEEARQRARAQASGSVDQVADLRRSLERRQQSLERRFGEQEGQSRSGERSASARRQGQGQQGAEGREGQGQQGAEGREGQGQQGREGQGRQGEGEGQQGRGASRGHASRGAREGTGAPGREGGHESLVFGGEAEMDPDRLAFQPLPEGRGGEAGELWGLEAADPQRSAGPAGAAGAKGTAAQGEGTAGPGAQPLLPRNRDVVKRYFGGR
ncbi:hypothetical protein LZ198_25635 [Myxococcus sp. K15C18031901]|uniref:hypothetical protein n=1 Tax=Myxococcus dinghuensis TaxID=2906761 RepID=UPI0020A77EC7|nr:hypothetical protein [Myxococcus dinghuensis]MCP3102256.1 hypothetical protein [Myxococcus dinghuensis]